MTIKVVDEIPKQRRSSRIMSTQEYQDILDSLEKLPSGKFLEVSFSPKTIAVWKNEKKTVGAFRMHFGRQDRLKVRLVAGKLYIGKKK